MLNVLLLRPTSKLPTVNHWGEDTCYDLYADIEEPIQIPPGEIAKIPTGNAIEFVPRAGAVIRSRSSMAVLHSSIEGGEIDAGYRGEITVLLRNNSRTGMLVVQPGSKIAQFRKIPVAVDEVRPVTQLGASKRGEKGFGSSGQ